MRARTLRGLDYKDWGENAADRGEAGAGLGLPDVEGLLHRRPGLFQRGRLVHHPLRHQPRHDILRQDETVLAHLPERIGPGRAAQPRALGLQPQQEPGEIRGRPVADPPPEGPGLVPHPPDEIRVVQDRLHLRRRADDAGIADQLMRPIGRLEGDRGDVEAQKRLFDPRPFLFDHGPGNPGLQDPPRELRQPAVVRDRRQRVGAQGLGDAFQHRRYAALALGGNRQDLVIAAHSCPPSRVPPRPRAGCPPPDARAGRP